MPEASHEVDSVAAAAMVVSTTAEAVVAEVVVEDKISPTAEAVSNDTAVRARCSWAEMKINAIVAEVEAVSIVAEVLTAAGSPMEVEGTEKV